MNVPIIEMVYGHHKNCDNAVYHKNVTFKCFHTLQITGLSDVQLSIMFTLDSISIEAVICFRINDLFKK